MTSFLRAPVFITIALVCFTDFNIARAQERGDDLYSEISTAFERLDSRPPTLSPRDADWLVTEWQSLDPEKPTARSLAFLGSKEYSLGNIRGALLEAQSCLKAIRDSRASKDKGAELFQWVRLMRTLMLGSQLADHFTRLKDSGLISDKDIGLDARVYWRPGGHSDVLWYLWGDRIWKEILDAELEEFMVGR